MCLLLARHAFCAQSAEPATGRFGTQAQDLAFPSATRVIAGFVITAVGAVGLALALRKTWPLIAARATPSANIRPLGRASLSRTLTVHLVEVDGIRTVMVEGRGAVTVVVLGPGPSHNPSA
jgi:hypothetical protein